MIRIATFILFMSVSLIVDAQIAGGYVKRNNQQTTKKQTSHRSKSNVPYKKVQHSYAKHVKSSSKSVQSCPNNKHPHMIDLGLPSGTKWACCNVGAIKPEDYGDFYAWGETEIKSYYYWNTYINCSGSLETCHFIGNDISCTKYDVAHVKWGGTWVMPSEAQLDELLNKCAYKWTTLNHVKGYQFIGKNGFSIFLPAAGHLFYDINGYDGKYGIYWSSTLCASESHKAYGLFFDSVYLRNYEWSYFDRYEGRTVRPVSR